jgi:transcriptional regulator with XRE-family HTH domain
MSEDQVNRVTPQEVSDDYRRRLGCCIRACRLERALTRKELVKRAGSSERYLAYVEAGKANPTVNYLRNLAMAFGVPLGRFIQDIDGPSTTTSLQTSVNNIKSVEM